MRNHRKNAVKPTSRSARCTPCAAPPLPSPHRAAPLRPPAWRVLAVLWQLLKFYEISARAVLWSATKCEEPADIDVIFLISMMNQVLTDTSYHKCSVHLAFTVLYLNKRLSSDGIATKLHRRYASV